MRIFFTGAFRKPRELNWLIGTTMFALALAEGFAGYSLPDDLLSGTGLRIAQGIMLSIPVVGTYVSFFVFGGGFPGEDFIPRLFTIHILLIPGLLVALISAHLMIIWHQKHGSLRIMPRLNTEVAGHTISWNVFLPAVVLPVAFLTLIALYPFFERWVVGDARPHHLCDRPRNAPTRTAVGVATIVWYGNLWAAGGNDVIAATFGIPLEATTWIFRIGFFAAPIIAFVLTRRLCLSAQRRDASTAEEGVESGIIKRLPSGEFIEVHDRPAPEEAAITEVLHSAELVRPFRGTSFRCRHRAA
jgi:quinol-cytochrome oxidoreductase complex cytochrome b subunit